MLETRFVPLGYRSVNPGTDSILNPQGTFGQMKTVSHLTSFLSFFDQSFE
jgi:hypothetical protein